MTVATKRYTVYRLYGAERNPLYVGCTKDLEVRLATHAQQRQWWPDVAGVETEVFESWEDARVAELATIRKLVPRHNSTKPSPYTGERTTTHRRIDGRKVQQLRLSRRLTQKQLGMEADVSNETVNKIERAREPKSVNLLTAYKIAGALGVDARELLED